MFNDRPTRQRVEHLSRNCDLRSPTGRGLRNAERRGLRLADEIGRLTALIGAPSLGQTGRLNCHRGPCAMSVRQHDGAGHRLEASVGVGAAHAEVRENHAFLVEGFDVFKQIAVGTDGSEGANLAMGKAIELASLTGATLHVVTVHKLSTAFHMAAASDVGVPAVNIIESNEEIRGKAERVCQEAVRRAESAGVKAEAHVVPGDPADELLKVADDAHCDLLVVGNRGMTGARRFVLGSVPNKLSHHAQASLLIVDTSEARA